MCAHRDHVDRKWIEENFTIIPAFAQTKESTSLILLGIFSLKVVNVGSSLLRNSSLIYVVCSLVCWWDDPLLRKKKDNWRYFQEKWIRDFVMVRIEYRKKFSRTQDVGDFGFPANYFVFLSVKSWKQRHWFPVDLSTVSNAKHFFSKTGCHPKIRSAVDPASWAPVGSGERSIRVFLKAIMRKLTQQLKVGKWAWVINSAFLVDRRKTTHISLDYWWYVLLR